MNLLEIQNLRVGLLGIKPVKGVSLAVKRGEFVGLVGGSGSGKSTLALSVLQLQPEAKLSGRILFNRRDLLKLDEESLNQIRGAKISMIFQEPMTSLNPLHTIGRQILEMLKLHRLSEANKQKVYDLLRLVELDNTERVYHSYPHELSGGQRQRAMIAMALAARPDLLIADEPTTALDVTVQAQILALLKTLQQKLNLSVLFITHDLEIVRRLADRVYVMKYGKIIATRLPDESLREKVFLSADPNAETILSVRDLTVRYGRLLAADGVSFDLKTGQTTALVGESGSGKSTIARALVRLIPATGKIFLNGKNFMNLSGKELIRARADVQMVFQDAASSLNPRLSVGSLVGEGWCLHNKGDAKDAVASVLKSVGLHPDIVNRYPHELSGGQRTRIALARVLILKPKVLILDEVTSSLDIFTQKQLIQLLLSIQEEFGVSYLFISHDMQAVKLMAHRVMVMKQARIVENGTVEQVFDNPQNAYTKQLLKDSFVR